MLQLSWIDLLLGSFHGFDHFIPVQVCIVRPEGAFALLSMATLPIEVIVVVHYYNSAQVAHGLATLWT